MQRAFEKSAMQAEISLGVSQRHPRPGVAILQPCPGKAARKKAIFSAATFMAGQTRT